MLVSPHKPVPGAANASLPCMEAGENSRGLFLMEATGVSGSRIWDRRSPLRAAGFAKWPVHYLACEQSPPNKDGLECQAREVIPPAELHRSGGHAVCKVFDVGRKDA